MKLNFFTAAIKGLLFALLLISYVVLTSPLLFIHAVVPFKTKMILARIVSLFSKALVFMMGIDVDYIEEKFQKGNHLIVSNHLSYLDILILSSIRPSCFVTSIEMKQTPILGQLCILGGCLFVERRSKKNLTKEISEITRALEKGLNVIVFPEATSTNGEKVLRFRSPLLNAALLSEKNVLPAILNYNFINGESVSLENRDSVFWYGDMTFGKHLWGVFNLSDIKVSATFSEEIESVDFDCPKELAKDSQRVVETHYRALPKSLPLGYQGTMSPELSQA